jgi:hypothetical protein
LADAASAWFLIDKGEGHGAKYKKAAASNRASIFLIRISPNQR